MTSTLLPTVPGARLRQLLAGFASAQVLVVGDAMLDRFTVGRVTRISPEAPVPVVAFERDMHRVGGAANVAHNITALGGVATLVAVVGSDAAADALESACHVGGVATSLVHDAGRPTTTKARIVTERNQQVARVDYESDADINGGVEAGVLAAVQDHAARAAAIVVSDYRKGVVTASVMAAVVAAAVRTGAPVLVDPKIPNLARYVGATVITPNHHEAEVATHLHVRTSEDARRAARAFREKAQCANVLMTRGDQGMWLLAGDIEAALPATAREVADVTGAGDTVIATLALALAAGATLAESAWLANTAAGIVVGKFGPAVVTPEELLGATPG